LDVAIPELKWLSRFLASISHAVYLIDRDGIVLYESTNNPEIREVFGLLPGFDRSENSIGTSGAGVALITNQPAIVIGQEHFSSRFSDYSSLGSPIHIQDEKAIGAIGVCLTIADADKARLDLVSYIARMIDCKLSYKEEVLGAQSLRAQKQALSVA